MVLSDFSKFTLSNQLPLLSFQKENLRAHIPMTSYYLQLSANFTKPPTRLNFLLLKSLKAVKEYHLSVSSLSKVSAKVWEILLPISTIILNICSQMEV